MDAETGKPYWYHQQTQETRWEDPNAAAPAPAALVPALVAAAPAAPPAPAPAPARVEELWHACVDQTEPHDIYFYNAATEETRWEAPASSATVEVVVEMQIAKAIGSFQARKPDQLTISPGEELDVINDTMKWWIVRAASGQRGKVPSNYVTLISKTMSPTDVAAAQARVAAPTALEEVSVQLVRGPQGYGLMFTSVPGQHVVQKVSPDAAQQGVCVNDVLVSINNTLVAPLAHDGVLEVLRNGPPRAMLVVHREIQEL